MNVPHKSTPAEGLRAHAVAAQARGFSVFRCKPNGKEPLGGHGHKDATANLEEIHRLWTRSPWCNIGISCEPSHLVVIDLDVDAAKGLDGIARWAELCEAEGWDLPPTYTVATPRGGQHLYYRLPDGCAVVKGSGSAIAPGIDVKAAGGYVIGAGSKGANGIAYNAQDDSEEVAPIPGELLEYLTAKPATVTRIHSSPSQVDHHRSGVDPLAVAALETDRRLLLSAPEGQRNITLNLVTFHMSQLEAWGRGHPDAYQVLREAALQVGLPERETDKTMTEAWKSGQEKPGKDPGPRRDRAGSPPLEERWPPPLDALEEEEPHRAWRIADLRAPIPDAPPALIHQVWPKGGSITISAKEGQGKSYLALYMAICLALGRECVGTPAGKPQKVLYVDREMDLAELKTRCEVFGTTLEELADSECFFYSEPVGPVAIDDIPWATALLHLADDYGIEVLIIDTMSKVIGGDENDNGTYQKLHTLTSQPLKQRGVSVLMLDHLGHQGLKGRGASAKGQNVDVPWTLTLKGSPGSTVLSLKRTKTRMPSLGPEEVTLTEMNVGGHHTYQATAGGYSPWTRACMDDLLGIFGGDLSRIEDTTMAAAKDLLRSAGLGRASETAEGAWRALKNQYQNTSKVIPQISGMPLEDEADNEPF